MSTTVADQQIEIRTLIETWEKCANTKDASGIAAMYAEDATLLPPGQPAIKGRENIQAFWQGFFDAGASDAKLKSAEIGSWNRQVPRGVGAAVGRHAQDGG
jgi:uncharacterized protein (TIGR02246 family)